MMTSRTASALILILAAGAALTACGKQGELERPAPMTRWGEIPQSAPGSKEENMDPASNNRTPSQAPLPGTNNPFGSQQPSAVLR